MEIIKDFNQAKNILDRSRSKTKLLFSDVNNKIQGVNLEDQVKEIIFDVQKNGDQALKYYTEKFDHINLTDLEVTTEEISKSLEAVDNTLFSNLKTAAIRIKKFHTLCLNSIQKKFEKNGIGRFIRPINRIGIYVPGGTAAYPSTVLMTAIPAKVAGVKEIVMVSPPQKDGTIPASTLVAAHIAKVNRIFKVGGAQAISALAYGTETIPRVDKICGPGNIYVALAKKLVYGDVDIDGIQGPTEIIVVADDTAKPEYCAADLIAQAEHDLMAVAILITTSDSFANKVKNEIEKQLIKTERINIAGKAINTNGLIVIVKNIGEALELVNEFAPEHLLIMIQNAKKYLTKIKNAGCIFVGDASPVVIGDYIAGPSHVLPTGGTARFSSPLSVEDFIKVTNYVALNSKQLKKLAGASINIAQSEGLTAHARAIKIRISG